MLFGGSIPLPNTSDVGLRKDGKTQNQFVMNLLRMHHVDVDVGDGPGSSGVPLPALSTYNADGDLVRHFDEWDLFAVGSPAIRTQWLFPAMLLIDHRPRCPPRWSTSSNFDAPSDTRGGMSPAKPGQQVRLYNLCTYKFWSGGATQCILVNALAKEGEGYYTLVISAADINGVAGIAETIWSKNIRIG